jgi:hypothetical protein
MEIIESIAWITLGFLSMFGSMELAWRLGKRRFKKMKIEKKVPVHVILQK